MRLLTALIISENIYNLKAMFTNGKKHCICRFLDFKCVERKAFLNNKLINLKFCQSGPNASLSHESLGTGRFSLPGHFVLQGSCRFCRGLSRTMWLLLLWPPQRTCTSFQTVTRSAPVGPWLSPSPLADSFCEVRMRSALPSWSLAYGRCSNICWQLNKWMKGGDLVLLLRVYRWFLH